MAKNSAQLTEDVHRLAKAEGIGYGYDGEYLILVAYGRTAEILLPVASGLYTGMKEKANGCG